MCNNLVKCGPLMLDVRTCGVCPECRERKINDLIGRCLAEQLNPAVTQAFAVELTYRDDPNTGEAPLGSLVVQYEDFTSFVDKLRLAGRSRRSPTGMAQKRQVRFLCAGEYGPAKGRVHFHAVVFILGEPVRLPQFRARVEWEMWPHGFSWLKPADYKSMRYAVKYALKPPDDTSYGYVKKPRYSKQPPLGDAFFQQYAADHVSKRLAVWDGKYKFAHVPIGTLPGQPLRDFFMQGVTLRNFLRRYVEGWFAKYGELPPMTEFLVDNYFDPLADEEMRDDAERLVREIESKRRRDPLVRRSTGVGAPQEKLAPIWFRRHIGTFFLAETRGRTGGVAAAFSDGALSVRFGDTDGVVLNARAGEGFVHEADALGLGPTRTRELVEWVRRRCEPQFDPPGVVYSMLDGTIHG